MVRSRHKIWALMSPRPVNPDPVEKQAIISACETFIATVLKPRFLPIIMPSEFNYMINIHGDWKGGRYRFMRRYRSGHSSNAGMEFDAPFAWIDRMGSDTFDIYWMRHTGTWHRLNIGKTLSDALRILETDEVLFPH